MAGAKKKAEVPEGALIAKAAPSRPEKAFIDDSWTFEDVLECDAKGHELIFQYEKNNLIVLNEEQFRQLSRDAKTRYSMARDLASRYDAGANDFHHRIQISQSLKARTMTEREMKQLPQSAQAARKLTAWVGEGRRPHWFRPDELTEAMEKGYEFVTPEMVERGEALTTISPTNGHFECKRPGGETDLVLMRIRDEEWQHIEAAKAEKRDRMQKAVENSGRSVLRNLGGNPDAVSDRPESTWQKVGESGEGVS